MTPPPGLDHTLDLPIRARLGARRAGAMPGDLAAARLAARRARLRGIRLRALGIAVALFTALWIVIFMQLASGHDPVLSSVKSAAAVAQSSTTKATSSSSFAGTGSTSAVTSSQS